MNPLKNSVFPQFLRAKRLSEWEPRFLIEFVERGSFAVMPGNAARLGEGRFAKYLPWLREPTTVAIVGNGPIDCSQALEIDSHDVVVRFNGCRNFGASGYRTDYLVLTNTGEPARQFAFDPHALNAHALKAAGSILLARPPDLVAREVRKFPRDREYWETFDRELVENRIGHKHWSYMRASIYREARATLIRYGAKKSDQPSTGMLALFYLARNFRKRLRSSALTLYGFTHQGWDRHPWNAERALIDDLWRDWIRRAEAPDP
ncbi:hypothetical protein [Hyphomicrobium sp.]|uniref:hypothetical protein n=1 Tax=Hyphomicrobium sp. TaxID=82 RepID=UPI002D79B38E|nr:hypothetical protein [Hyphomicrobium sp.]HET6390997.1 hypothetical protein [Hyphomicrobium sp.]